MTYGTAYIFDEFKKIFILMMVLLAIGTTLLLRPCAYWFMPFMLEHIYMGNNPMMFLVQFGMLFSFKHHAFVLKFLPFIG